MRCHLNQRRRSIVIKFGVLILGLSLVGFRSLDGEISNAINDNLSSKSELSKGFSQNQNQLMAGFNFFKKDSAQKKKVEQRADQNTAKPLQVMKPKIEESRVFMGSKDAKVTIVEYSDFRCPYCSNAYLTMKTLIDKKYKGKVRLLYKHLPGKPHSKTAAQYYEAIALQDHQKAIQFHDFLYENQSGIRGGETFLKETAKKLGVNLKKLKKDIQSKKVKDLVTEDHLEAINLGFGGTPCFMINDITIMGARSVGYFSEIIDYMLKQ